MLFYNVNALKLYTVFTHCYFLCACFQQSVINRVQYYMQKICTDIYAIIIYYKSVLNSLLV